MAKRRKLKKKMLKAMRRGNRKKAKRVSKKIAARTPSRGVPSRGSTRPLIRQDAAAAQLYKKKGKGKKSKKKKNKNKGGGYGDDIDTSTGYGIAPMPEPKSYEQIQAEQDRDMTAAEAYAKKVGEMFFSEGSFGRLDENRTAEEQAVLDRFMQAADTAGLRSDDVSELLALRKEGLDGYTDNERAMMREDAAANMDREAQAQRRQALARNARLGIRGGAAAQQFREIDRNRAMQERELSRDIFLSNMQEKARRRDSYQQALYTAEQAEFERGRGARADYGAAFTNQQNRDDARKTFNLEQRAAEIGGRAGAYGTGMANYLSGLADRRGEAHADQVFAWQQNEADRARDHQEKILAKQFQHDKKLFSMQRRDAYGR